MTEPYAHEVGTPTISQCGSVSLLFNGKSLRMQGGKRERVYIAVSGIPGPAHLEAERHAQFQDKANSGPIPEGQYWIRLDEIQKNWFGKRRSQTAWGDYWVTIHAYPGTKRHGRGGFFIHGGTEPGSIGCIDLTDKMEQFVKDIREEADGEDECFVPLTVKYG